MSTSYVLKRGFSCLNLFFWCYKVVKDRKVKVFYNKSRIGSRFNHSISWWKRWKEEWKIHFPCKMLKKTRLLSHTKIQNGCNIKLTDCKTCTFSSWIGSANLSLKMVPIFSSNCAICWLVEHEKWFTSITGSLFKNWLFSENCKYFFSMENQFIQDFLWYINGFKDFCWFETCFYFEDR